jgi:ribA/ribD-fused uncharacterized protein
MLRCTEDLLSHLDTHAKVDYLFFWGHTPKATGRVDKACLSQWFPRAFEVDGVTYPTAEHFMMAEKARLFADEETRQAIVGAKTAAEAKNLGRQVRNYDDQAWSNARFEAVVRGNVAKFGAHEDLRAFLLSTDRKVLVEASPTDRIWGIGMAETHADARLPARWLGKNLLGFALMNVRDVLRG